MNDKPEPFRTPVRFALLVELLPDLEKRAGSGLTFNRWGTPPTFDPLASKLYTVAHEAGCIDTSFDWPAWKTSAKRYVEPGGVEGADLDACFKLLTIIVRQERFAEGSLSEHVESGFAARLVRRIAELAPRCTSCGSFDAVPFLYGEPAPGVKGSMLGPAPEDAVVLGGCNVMPDAPAWKCRACRHEFGRLEEREPWLFKLTQNEDG